MKFACTCFRKISAAHRNMQSKVCTHVMSCEYIWLFLLLRSPQSSETCMFDWCERYPRNRPMERIPRNIARETNTQSGACSFWETPIQGFVYSMAYCMCCMHHRACIVRIVCSACITNNVCIACMCCMYCWHCSQYIAKDGNTLLRVYALYVAQCMTMYVC